MTMIEQIEMLKAMMRKKDEALEQFLIGAKHESCMYAPEDPDPTWHCCNWSEVVEKIEAALSLTPSSVAEYAANERVGRAVVEWHKEWRHTLNCNAPSRDLEATYKELGQVIAKARGEQP